MTNLNTQEAINENIEKCYGKIYTSCGLNADWSSTAFQLNANSVLIDTEVDDEWVILCYWLDADGEKHFDGDGIAWTGTLLQSSVLLSDLEDCKWQCDDCEGESKDVAVANAHAILQTPFDTSTKEGADLSGDTICNTCCKVFDYADTKNCPSCGHTDLSENDGSEGYSDGVTA